MSNPDCKECTGGVRYIGHIYNKDYLRTEKCWFCNGTGILTNFYRNIYEQRAINEALKRQCDDDRDEYKDEL